LLLHIVARGRIAAGPEGELVDRYLKRIAWPSKVTELPESGGRVPPPAESSVTILLDEKGEQLGSVEFARRLEAWRDGGKREARFMLGGADGFDDAERGAGGPAAGVRAGDLATSPGSRHAGRTIVAGDEHPCEPPLSSRRIG
jgi:hypothetical protein